MSTTDALAAIAKTITVDASVDTAFKTFTREISSWWPTGSHRVFEDGSSVVFEEQLVDLVTRDSMIGVGISSGMNSLENRLLRWR